MAVMVSEVYDALREIGVSEEKARAAAEAMATLEPQLTSIRSDLRVLKWQVGALFALFAFVTVPTLWLVLRIAAKVGALPA